MVIYQMTSSAWSIERQLMVGRKMTPQVDCSQQPIVVMTRYQPQYSRPEQPTLLYHLVSAVCVMITDCDGKVYSQDFHWLNSQSFLWMVRDRWRCHHGANQRSPGCRISMMKHITKLLGLRMEHTKPPTRLLAEEVRSHLHQLISGLALCEFEKSHINAKGI